MAGEVEIAPRIYGIYESGCNGLHHVGGTSKHSFRFKSINFKRNVCSKVPERGVSRKSSVSISNFEVFDLIKC